MQADVFKPVLVYYDLAVTANENIRFKIRISRWTNNKKGFN